MHLLRNLDLFIETPGTKQYVSFFDSLHDLFNTLNRLSRRRHHLFNNNKTSLPTLSWSNIKNATKPETEQF
jgi:hypothetical protein